jgi:phage gp36-like protein
MANQLSAVLQAVASLAASTTGESVDIGTRTAGHFSIEVDAVAGSGHAIALDTSPDETTWRQVFTRPFSAPNQVQIGLSGLQRYVRSRVTVAGSGTLLVSVEIEAHQLYCDKHSLVKQGLPTAALDSLSDEEILEICLSVTDECDSYLGAAYALPLIQWGRDLRLHATKMLVRYLMDKRGWDPGGEDAPIMMGHEQALKWLDKVSKGSIKPAGIIDSTIDVVDSGSVVVSSPRRESFRF